MKTKSQFYRKSFPLCAAILLLLPLAAPAVASQTDPIPGATGGQAKKEPAAEDKSKGGAEETAGKAPAGSKSSASTKTQAPQVNRGPASTPPLRPGNTEPPPNQEIAELKAQIATIRESYVSKETFGLLEWLTTPVVGLIALLLLIALSLHLLHFLRASSLSSFVTRLAKSHAALGQAAKGDRSQVNNTAVERFAAELERQTQALNQFANRLNQMDGRLKANDDQFEDAAQAITLAANWIGQSQLKTAFANDGGNLSDSERASAIAMLERYREPFRQNFIRVEAVSQALGELADAVRVRSYMSPELSSRVQTLFQGINRFDRWHAEVADELNSLQLGSFSQRSHLLQAGQIRLMDQVNQGSLTVAQMVQKSRELMENHFPEPSHRPVKETPAVADRETNLKKIRDGACDYLMDWYNSLFQFQHQLEQGQRSAAEAELVTEVGRIQQLAREALNKFDLQPEAINIGQTQYDRRLHEAILVRQSQFPLNTVIEIHECGFRKMSTGEALRRPQVTVAGARAN